MDPEVEFCIRERETEAAENDRVRHELEQHVIEAKRAFRDGRITLTECVAVMVQLDQMTAQQDTPTRDIPFDSHTDAAAMDAGVMPFDQWAGVWAAQFPEV